MNEKHDFIIFGFNDWPQWAEQGWRTRNGMIAKKLAEHPDVGKVIVLSTAKSIWINLFRAVKSGRLSDFGKLAPFRLSKVAEKVFVLDHTRLLPREDSYEICYRINGFAHDRSLAKKIRKLIKELKMDNPILWVSNPLMAKHLGRLGEKLSVFDAIDDWSAHPQKISMTKSINRAYQLINKKANLILTVSKSLAKKLGNKREGVYWMPNGIDVELFKPRDHKIPAELARLPRPIIGYVGVLQERLDTDVLATIAEGIPESSLVLMGPVVTPHYFRPLESYSNIHFLGEKHHSQIPKYLHFFDICLLPHKNNALTISMNPLKLYEYLAMEKPVIATDHPGLEEFSDLVTRVAGSENFVQAILALAKANRNGFAKRCREFVNDRTWDKKVEEILRIIEAHDCSFLRSAKSESIA